MHDSHLLRRHRLVLNRDAPDGDAFALVRLDELRVVVGPGLIKLRFQFSTVKHVVVVLHECRRTPGAAQRCELSAGRGQRLFDERNAKLLVMLDAERLQLLVAFVDVGVAATREIAAVDVGSGERVADACVDIEIGVQEFLLFAFGNFANVSAEASVSAPPMPRIV